MTTLHEAAQMALEALTIEEAACAYEHMEVPEHIAKAIEALREALAQQGEQQPEEAHIREAISCIHSAKMCNINSMSSRHEMLRLMDKAIESLHTALSQRKAAPAAQPLTITEDSAWNLARYVYARSNPHDSPQILLSAMEIKQIIEAAHGIGADK